MVSALINFWQSYRNGLVNFTAAEGPKYTGAHATVPAGSGGRFKVVSWNIKFGARIKAALEEFQRVPALQDADLILLQEMDDEGVQRIARELSYNYVYYPASIHNRTGRPFGNAVLSTWPIQHSHKLLLPHPSPTNRQRRIAVGAMLKVGQHKVLAYSVHTETPILSPARRHEQVVRLSDRVRLAQAGRIVVGGDFNTFSPRSVGSLQQTMASAGLSSVFDGRPATLHVPLGRFSLDHLFVRGFQSRATGVWSGTSASDHYPLWATLQLASPQKK